MTGGVVGTIRAMGRGKLMAGDGDTGTTGAPGSGAQMGSRQVVSGECWAQGTGCGLGCGSGGIGGTQLGDGPAGMGNGSGIGAIMADTAGGSTEGTGSGGITDFSGAARASDWAWAIGMAALGKDGAVGTDWGGIGGGSKHGARAGNGPVGTGSIRVGAAVAGMGREQTGGFRRAQGMGTGGMESGSVGLGWTWHGGGVGCKSRGHMTGAAGGIGWAEGIGGTMRAADDSTYH